jgi:pyruvate dehydrogenase E1 component alpha subunit
VPKYLWEEWGAKCPIVRLEKRMIERGEATRESIDGLYARLRAEVDEAIAWAEASPLPDPASLTEGVYEERG